MENPQWTDNETSVENPTLENPTLENPTLENPTLNKERNTKQEIQEKEIIYIDDTFINSKILEFIKNRKQLKKPMTDLAIEKLVAKTKNWMASQKNETITQWFDRAIEC